MKVTADIIREEFIGSEVKVAASRHADYVGLSGKVIDESRNTFTILNSGEKVIVKESVVFQFKFPDETIVEIDGKLLVGRPEDRLKKQIRRFW